MSKIKRRKEKKKCKSPWTILTVFPSFYCVGSEHTLTTGRMSSPCAVFSTADRTTPSRQGYTSEITPRGQQSGGARSSIITTTVPDVISRAAWTHFCRHWRLWRYSSLHRRQKAWTIEFSNCGRFRRFESIPDTSAAGRDVSDLAVRKCAGVRATGSARSPPKRIKGIIFKTASTWVRTVLSSSYERSCKFRKFQHFLWRFDNSQPLQTYELQTVTFGISSSPFLAKNGQHGCKIPWCCPSLDVGMNR